MPLILGTNSIKDTGFNVANSCRYNDGDSPSLHKSFSSASRTTYTVSMWVKRSNLVSGALFYRNVDGNNYCRCFFEEDDLKFADVTSGSDNWLLITDRKFRDCSAWYHIVVVCDTTNGTAGNRQRIYVNGVEETSFSTETNSDTAGQWGVDGNHYIGNNAATNYFFDGYMAEVCYIDGTALTPSSFGEYDEDSPTIWKPKDVSGLTFGTNGYYFDFKASDNLGNDANGGTDFTETGLAAVNQATDSPTNSFCVINPLDEPYGTVTLSEGNLTQIQSSNYPYNRSTIGVAKGKWYCEGLCVSTSNDATMGIVSHASLSDTDWIHATANNYGYYNHVANHGAYSNNALVVSTNYDAYTDDDVISVAMDLDNNKLYFAKNGTWANSGDPTSGATGTGAVSITAAASTVDGFYFPSAADYGGSPRTTWSMNFGNPPHSISSGNADGDGYGNFEYAPPSGYYALCTKNLAEYG